MMLYHSLLTNIVPGNTHNYTNSRCSTNKILLFDIDDTLYNATPEMRQKSLDENVKRLKDLGIKGDLPQIYKEYKSLYGSMWKGIQIHHPKIDRDLFSELLDKEKEVLSMLKRDDELIDILSSIKGYDMYCFTSAPLSHALDVLEYVGVKQFIIGIFYPDFTGTQVATTKPEKDAYNDVMERLGDREMFFFDDTEVNIKTAIECGWNCKLITMDYSIKDALKPFLDNKEDAM